MNVRRFHQLDSDLTGLDIFYNWLRSPKSPIKSSDISLIYNGKEIVDTTVDFLAIGDAVMPCLTQDNLIDTVNRMTETEKNTLRLILGVPTKDDMLSWLQSAEGSKAIEDMGFVRK